MTMATPPTPDLTAENGSSSTASADHADPSSNGDTPVFSDGNGSKNGNGNGSKKKKKKKQAKKGTTTPSSPDDAVASSPSHDDSANGDGDGDHHKHARDPSVDARPIKKQRSTRTLLPPSSSNNNNASNASHNVILFAAFFVLGLFVTLPVLFSMGTHLSCGGAREVNSLVDGVLVKKARGVGTLDMIQHLNHSSSTSIDSDGGEKSKRKDMKSSASNDNDEEVGFATTTLHESMCHVASIAIGHFVHHVPYAQILVLRNPFTDTNKDLESPDAVSQMESEQTKEASKRKGIFKRVVSTHKEKHQDANNDDRHKSASSEEIDRKHPLRHMLESASIFSRNRKEKKMKKKKEKELQKKQKQQQQKKKEGGGDVDGDDIGGEREVDWKKWKYAMSDDYEPKSREIGLIQELRERVFAKAETLRACNDANVTVIDDCSEDDTQIVSLSGGSNMPDRPLQERLDAVSWGGIDADSAQWWTRKCGKETTYCQGGRILTAHLKIMKWPEDLRAKYPFRLCAKGCESEVSMLHTLEWREKYKPWCASDAAMKFNDGGFIYHRGHSRAGPKQRSEASKSGGDRAMVANGGHSMVWYRLGLASASENPDLYMRGMINALDSAVGDSLVRNKGAIGRFNVVMDCEGMTSKHSPSIANVKKLFSVLQDHYPDRLGVLLAANLSGLTQMLMKMVLPFVTEDVRAKIHIIPNDPDERREMLLQFMEEEEVPYYLGGKDEYRFDAKEYYQGKCILPEESILEYQKTMPYHA